MKKLSWTGTLPLGLFFASVAFASPEFFDTFLKKYNVKDGSPLAEKSCGICHVSESDFTLNPYGKQLAHEMVNRNASEVTPAILAAVESLDANNDGKSNRDTIAEGAPPGGEALAAATPQETQKPAWYPKNAFHPAIVHFPIALFVAGLLLDLYGLIRKDRTFLFAGWFNLLLAAIAAVAASLTGVAAGVMSRVPFRGLLAEHMALALAAAFLMWIMVALRVHRHQKMNLPARLLYYVLAVVAIGTLSYGGHLGGMMVYGE